MRRIAGILAGAVAAVLVISLVEYVGHLAMPATVPAIGDSAALETYIAAMPPAMRALVVFGWFLGALTGGAVALTIARWTHAPWFVAGLVAIGGIVSAVQVPSPMWMQLASVLAPALGGWVAVHFGRRALAGR
jgi:hypothetical protein